ncbi:hybrid sensor histidine kinase/response regulator transcription factor [Pleomorphovibrio marinus]|uniref:hybrid sensor histidine kinase/response regulator transcription factor n=1 Tax=Pleomorphovibrio marinus TaxID=2164132 RepID=UPI000E0A0BF6|nr:two-component regulator propeller domain-containing protein [Pleomorphovibrio marinus]
MGRIIFIWFFGVTTSMVPSALIAQNEDLIFQRFSIQEGLSHNSVLSIIQDRRGFIWIATYDGLNRFDGYQFKEYNHDYQDTTSISQNLSMALHEDSEGRIWVGTAGLGLCHFDPQTDKFTRYSTTFEENGEYKEVPTISTIQEDLDGNIWFGSVNGLFKIGPDSKRPLLFSLGSNRPVINSLTLDASGNVWVGTFGEGLFKIPYGDNSSYIQWKHDLEVQESIASDNVMAVFEDHQGTFWIGYIGGMDSLDRNTGDFIHFRHNPDDPNSLSSDILNTRAITEDKWGNLWIGTANGLNKLNKERTVFTRYHSDPNNPHSIGSNDIHAVLLDNMGNLWLGTVNGGVSLSNLQPREFYLLQNEPDNPNSLSSNMVRAIFEDKDEMLWIGTEGGGLNKYNRKDGTFTHYKHEPDNPKSLLNNLVSSVLEDSKGNFWIGYGGNNFYVNNGGVTKIDSSSNSFIHFDIQASKISGEGDRDVVSIFEDKSGTIWLITQNGLKRFSPGTESWDHFLHSTSNPEGISDFWCYAIFEDSRDDLWIGTGAKALNRMDKKREGIFHHFIADQNLSNGLSSHSIRHIVEDRQGYLWFATSGGGLCQYDPKTEYFTPYTQNDGLPSNTINRIEIDELGKFWMSTNKGICRFDPISKEVQSFDLGYGSLKHHFTTGYFNAGSSTKGKDGTLYFGGSDGVVYFHPQKIKAAPNPAPVVLTQFNIFDKPVSEWDESMNIILPHHQNFISMEFAALSFVNAHNNKYAYFLENFDQDWIYSDDRRFVSYTNLSPGEYTFRVKAANYDGVWSESGINLNLTILPPWWRTWWAYLLFMLLAVTAFYWMRRSIIHWERLNSDLKLQRIEAEKMHELDQAKSAFFANISHEFRTPLTLISGTVDTLKKKEGKSSSRTEAYELIERNASKLLHLIHQLLDFSKLESGKLKVEAMPGSITDFLEHLTGSFVSLFERRKIYFQSELPEDEVFAYFDASKLEMIFSNLLSNAYKFTPEGGEVVFMADLESEGDSHLKLTVRVKDTGIGIPKDKLDHIFDRFYQEESSTTRTYEGTGIGLSLVKEVVGLMGGEVSLISTKGKGSIFKVELPLKRIALNELNQKQYKRVVKRSFSMDHPQHLDRKTPNQSVTTVSDKPKILLVEDNMDLKNFIKGHLQDDYLVAEADNGLTGYDTALDTIPDLIVSDVMMPIMDGICLCEKLKHEDRTSHIPIILLTARADMESRLEGLGLGADDYLTKPFKIEELMARISNLLESRRKLREKYSNAISLDPKELSVTSVEERFVQKLLDIMEKHYTDPKFDVETLGKELGMSRTNLYRKLKAIINQHPTEFIQTFRLKKAVLLLKNNYGNISDVAYGIGFNSLTYFTRLFKKYYGMTPSDYIQQFSENKFPTQSKLQNYEKGND